MALHSCRKAVWRCVEDFQVCKHWAACFPHELTDFLRKLLHILKRSHVSHASLARSFSFLTLLLRIIGHSSLNRRPPRSSWQDDIFSLQEPAVWLAWISSKSRLIDGRWKVKSKCANTKRCSPSPLSSMLDLGAMRQEPRS